MYHGIVIILKSNLVFCQEKVEVDLKKVKDINKKKTFRVWCYKIVANLN
jgi:hypothetical protein